MSGLYAGLIGLAAVVLLALLYGRRSRRLGRAEAGRDTLAHVLDTARESGAIDEEVSGLADASLYAELYEPGANRVRLGAQNRSESRRSDITANGGADRRT